MIRIYCQYSYGGYKTFYLKGEENEEVCNEVTNDTPYDFPSDANLFFQHGGSKIAYKQLSNGEHTLVLREIPSIHTDSDGRSIPCALQLIGQDEDKKALDNLTLIIADDLNAFETFFSNLFYVRQGLHIHGEKLREYLDKSYGDLVCMGEVHPALRKVAGNTEKVHLFVSLSNKFGIDEDVTHRTRVELHLEAVRNYMTLSDLIKIQNKALPQLGPLEKVLSDPFLPPTVPPITDSTSDEKDNIIKSLKAENEELDGKYKKTFESLKVLENKLQEKESLLERLSDEIQRSKRQIKNILIGCAAILLLVIIGTCSGNRKECCKGTANTHCVCDSLNNTK